MRELTKEEIENAPDWATQYWIMTSRHPHRPDRVCYVDELMMRSQWLGETGCVIVSKGWRRLDGLSPITRKEFDISKHDFSDCDIESVEIDGYADDEYLHFDFKQETNELTHCKDDVIAMAKALKLTAEDLR